MTQDEIMDMAREAGLYWHTGWTLDDEEPNRFETFAKQIAAKAFQNGYEKGIAGFNEAVGLEREACALVCETRLGPTATEYYGETYAEAIRARGEE